MDIGVFTGRAPSPRVGEGRDEEEFISPRPSPIKTEKT